MGFKKYRQLEGFQELSLKQKIITVFWMNVFWYVLRLEWIVVGLVLMARTRDWKEKWMSFEDFVHGFKKYVEENK